MTNQSRLVTRPSRQIDNSQNKKTSSKEFKRTLLITFLHLPLGVILYNIGPFALIHPLITFFVGLNWAIKKSIPLERVAIGAAYFVGSEVLWRMAKIPVFWEFGKYGSAAIMIVALVRRHRRVLPKLPVVYFAALLPSCLLTIADVDPAQARSDISFNLSGPFLLLISCWFFSNVKVSMAQLRHILFALLIPFISVACVTSFYTATTENIQFNTESNFITSGGFGPNQVSSMLGLGVFLSIACLLLFENLGKLKAFLGIAAVFLATQCVLTFSRGGMYNAVGATIALLIFQFQNVSQGIRRLIPILILAGVFLYFVFPVLNNFTGGKLQERFEETTTTHRAEIVESDYDIFLENPVLGIGVGAANSYRQKYLEFAAASHTEFSRLLSEHGTFGLFALLSLALMAFFNFRAQSSITGRAFVAGISLWCILFMMGAGMRLAAPAFIWGLAFITIAAPLSAVRRIPAIRRGHQFA